MSALLKTIFLDDIQAVCKVMVLRRHHLNHTIRHIIHVRKFWAHDKNRSHRKVVQNYTNGKNGENA